MLPTHHNFMFARQFENAALKHVLNQIAEWLERGRVMYSDGFMSSEARRILKETES